MVVSFVRIFVLGLVASFALLATASGEETMRCGRLSVGVFEHEQGDYTHRVQVSRDDVALGSPFGSQGPPSVGCLRRTAVVLALGDPVEAEVVVFVFANGRHVGQLRKETKVDFHDGQVIVREPTILMFEDPEKVPAEFRDLFDFR